MIYRFVAVRRVALGVSNEQNLASAVHSNPDVGFQPLAARSESARPGARNEAVPLL